MNFYFIAGVLYLSGIIAISGTSLDDKVNAFEGALKTSPSAAITSPLGRTLSVQDLETMMEHGANEMNIEGIVTQLMATHISENVKQAGENLLQELEARRKAHAAAFEVKANGILAKVPDALTHAKKASDLDGILKDLQTLQNPQGESLGSYASQALVGKIGTTFQFVTQWQDYLSSLNSGNREEAQNSLRIILNNRQIDTPTFFPRSEILARLVEAGGENPKASYGTSGPTVTDPDVILNKIKKVDDLMDALPQLAHIPNPSPDVPWDWSELTTLDKARLDALAGLPIILDLKKAVNGPVWGGAISRIEAMELLVLLPYYFETSVSNSPKANETVSAYLDRLSETANTDGNLALLQRVIAVKVALASPQVTNPNSFLGTQQFLAGLSQDASGQYAPAVVSYENALKEPDSFLSVKIVGDRLAAIKAAHPEEFEKGLTTFMTPSPADSSFRPGMPPWMQFGRPGNPYGNQISVLPIPMTISIPARTTTTPDTGSTTNTPPSNPVSLPTTK